MNRSNSGRWLHYGALCLAGLFVAFWLLMGVGEMLAGDVSGASHLVPAVFVAAGSVLAWKRPLLGGLILLGLGLFGTVFFLVAIARPDGRLAALLLISGPVLLAGVLLVLGAVVARSANSNALHR